jgi:ABC-type sugar transport system substrate-binding protein/anti-anti-sigma regulatory factor
MHIGFATQDPRSHYWLLVGHAAHERAAELGIDITSVPTSHRHVHEQVAAIDAFIDQRVDAILVGPIEARGLGDAVERARAAGIPVIAVASPLLDCTVTCTVQSDQMKGAEMAAAYVVDQLGGAGEVAHIIGPTKLQDNVDRAMAIRKLFGLHQDIEIVFEQESPDWEPASGAALIRAALDEHPNIRGVCVANDTLALGVVEGIRSLGRAGQIVVTGFDAMPDALMSIHKGYLSATIQQSMRGIGGTAVEIAQRAARGQAVPAHALIDVALVTKATLLDAALETVYVLPSVLADTIERGDALARARDEVIQAQETALRELSTPLIPISDTVMAMPLIGSINTRRAHQILQTLLEGMHANTAHHVILDITGVPMVDTYVADTLMQAARAVKLLGAQVMLTGIRPEVAQTLVGLGVDLTGIVTRSTLQNGIAYALRQH